MIEESQNKQITRRSFHFIRVPTETRHTFSHWFNLDNLECPWIQSLFSDPPSIATITIRFASCTVEKFDLWLTLDYEAFDWRIRRNFQKKKCFFCTILRLIWPLQLSSSMMTASFSCSTKILRFIQNLSFLAPISGFSLYLIRYLSRHSGRCVIWLVCSTPGRMVRVRVLAGNIVLCS